LLVLKAIKDFRICLADKSAGLTQARRPPHAKWCCRST